MANEFRTLESHSAEYFGDSRDYWWNLDFLALLGKRVCFDRVQEALDVGCGVGHWGQLLAAILPPSARMQGVDRDPHWVERATARVAARGLADRFSYRVALAEKLPFADSSFDLVTCQTVLIHTPDPGSAVAEMVRVARPGGLVLAAEPNNLAASLVFNSLNFNDPIEQVMARVRLQLICQRGKAALGGGLHSIGDLVPGFFAKHSLTDIQVYLNDKTNPFLPPYDSQEQIAILDERADMHQRDIWIWSRDDARRYYLAGNSGHDDFELLWSVVVAEDGNFEQSIADRTYSRAGGSIGYIIAGRKPHLR